MSKLVFVSCPMCGKQGDFATVRNTDIDVHIDKYGDLFEGKRKSEWRVCDSCGFVHQNPRPSLEALNQHYLQAKYHDAVIPESWRVSDTYLAFARWYYGEKINYALEHSGLGCGAVFEIGFGYGGVLRQFHDRKWKTYGIEPDQGLVDFATRTLGLRGLQQGIVDRNTVIETKVDLVFSNHAFEHFADLHGVMCAVKKILKPGGYVFTCVPTYYRNRSCVSLEWMNSAHYSMFTHRSLDHLFSYYGLEEVTHTYRGWYKEIDDLWHVAKFTGQTGNSKDFYEDPPIVRRYINLMNPINSILYSPVYSNYARKVQKLSRIIDALGLLRSSPRLFLTKAFRRMGKGHCSIL